MTDQEKRFLNRVLLKMAETGKGMEEAGRMVLADDARIVEEVQRIMQDPGKRRDFVEMIAAPIHKAAREKRHV